MFYGFKKISFLTILLSALVFISSLSSLQAQGTQWIRNGSFEFHRDSTYPTGRSSQYDYLRNQLMKCIGFCKSDFNFQWTPSNLFGLPFIDYPRYCDYNSAGVDLNGGWYWATEHASADYFHKAGLNFANVDSVCIHSTYVGADWTDFKEKRLPYRPAVEWI